MSKNFIKLNQNVRHDAGFAHVQQPTQTHTHNCHKAQLRHLLLLFEALRRLQVRCTIHFTGLVVSHKNNTGRSLEGATLNILKRGGKGGSGSGERLPVLIWRIWGPMIAFARDIKVRQTAKTMRVIREQDEKPEIERMRARTKTTESNDSKSTRATARIAGMQFKRNNDDSSNHDNQNFLNKV